MRIINKFGRILSDKIFLYIQYWRKMNKWCNLSNPQTFNEKLQWLKLYDRKPEYIKMVDKYDVKQYVAEKIGDEYIVPTLGVWDRFEDIDFDKLPNKFVLKCTHDSGGLVICKDKSTFDFKSAKQILNNNLAKNYFYSGREWPYKNVQPRIIAEEYLEAIDNNNDLVEYKFFCFSGKVKMILVCKGEAHGHCRTNDFCDINLLRLPFTSLNPNSRDNLNIPQKLQELIHISEVLSKGIPHLRVDTYLVGNKIYFGELTFFHNSGFASFEPNEWDYKIGSWLELPEKSV